MKKVGRVRAVGRVYRRNREAVLAASDICVLCGHPGARQTDHGDPLSMGGDRDSVDNLYPAHGGNRAGLDNPCPTCGKRCNQVKGNGTRKVKPVVSRNW